MEIFRLFGSVLINGADDAKKKLDDIDTKGSSVGTKLTNMGSTALKAGGLMVTGLAAAGGAVLALANKSSESASRVSDLSQKMGMSTTAFQEWDFILAQNGTSIDSMQNSMKALANAATSGSDAFTQLGINVKNNDGTFKSQEQLFQETITALQGVDDTTQRAALANDLLGKASTELGPLLNSGAASVDELRKKAHDLGLVMSEEAVNAGEEFGDSMDQLKSGLMGMLNQAMGPLMPSLNQLIQTLIQLLPPIMGILGPLMEKLMPSLSEILLALLPPLLELIDAFMPLLQPLLDILLIIIENALIPVIGLLADMTAATIPLILAAVNGMKPVFEEVFTFVGDIIKGVADFVNNDLKGAFEDIGTFFEGMETTWKEIFTRISEFFTGIFTGIKDTIKSMVNGVINGLNALVRGLNKISFSVPSWVPGIGGKSWGFSLNEIPLLASGGDIQRSGSAIVGENGPELVELNRGARVTPLAGAGGIAVNLYYPSLLNHQAINTVGNQITKVIKQRTGLK